MSPWTEPFFPIVTMHTELLQMYMVTHQRSNRSSVLFLVTGPDASADKSDNSRRSHALITFVACYTNVYANLTVANVRILDFWRPTATTIVA